MPKGIKGFQKGYTPWNKGKPSWNKGLKGFRHSGSFKKGHKTNVGRKINPPITIECLICKREFKARASDKRKYCSVECSRINFVNQMPKNGWRWINDRSRLKKRNERNDSAYQNWAKQVKKRDNWKCKINNKDCSKKVVAHHILSWKDFPELRYDINNGITLCQFHHPKKRVEEQRLIPTFQKLVGSQELICTS